MAVLNRILSFFILILAIVTLVFGFLLAERRNELRQRGDMLADAVAAVVETLDKGSETVYKKDIHAETLNWQHFATLKDPNSPTYDAFNNMMNNFRTQATDVVAQRDTLGSAIFDVAEIMEKDGIDKAALTKVPNEAYKEPIDVVKEHLRDVHSRDEALISRIEESALNIGHPMTKDILKNLDEYETPLGQYVDDVKSLHKRATNYGDTLAQTVTVIDEFDFEVDVNKLKDETAYPDQLEAILSDFTNINETLKEYERNKVELEETKAELEKSITALEDATEQAARLDAKLANVEADLAVTLQKLEQLQGAQGGGQNDVAFDVVGKILEVNYDWNYVIVNLGAKNNLVPNIELTVAREQEFICKLFVTKVMDNYSVAEIMADRKLGTVIEGDRVIQ
jgi:exonuclease VII small subunit